jgi:hypothetical protein
MCRLITELASNGFAIEPPVDFEAVTVHPAIPGPNFLAQVFRLGILLVPRYCLERMPISISA